jgi:hypothetical protein
VNTTLRANPVDCVGGSRSLGPAAAGLAGPGEPRLTRQPGQSECFVIIKASSWQASYENRCLVLAGALSEPTPPNPVPRYDWRLARTRCLVLAGVPSGPMSHNPILRYGRRLVINGAARVTERSFP